MFVRDRLVRRWTTSIGPGLAEDLARAYLPQLLLIVTYPVWWAIEILHAVTRGPAHSMLGMVNAGFPVVLLAVVVVVLVLLRRVRNAIRRTLWARGFDTATRPKVLTPSRFRSWLAEAGVSPELAAELLSEAHPGRRATAGDSV
ncbi:hypothetical protein ACFQ9V_09570 [Leifsonia sp. NPDC056665]|uniref:hypothetical protein n=1 Tax=Leifsonia sp. NPDC056665 TaxID=3345901 RepID=UPI0036B6DBEE